MSRKVVIWDLMGGGCNSLRLALQKSNLRKYFKVYTFDIVKKSNGFKNIVFDLSTDNIIEKLNKKINANEIKKPDILISSSLCQSFSLAMRSISTLKDKDGNYFSGNPHHFWNHDTKKVETWPRDNIKWNGFSGNSYPKGRKSVPKFVGELGERCIQNIIKILCYFKPKNYYIENPANSLIWKYIKYNLGFTSGIKNVAHYSAYNENFSRKPTCFLSNIELNLKKVKNGQMSVKKVNSNQYNLILSGACKNNKLDELKRLNTERKLSKILGQKVSVSIKYKRNAMERSHIPPELILDILTKFLKNTNATVDYKSFKYELTNWTNKPSINTMLDGVSI